MIPRTRDDRPHRRAVRLQRPAMELAPRRRIEYANGVPSPEIAMAILPLRALGLLLLTIAISVASCQALFHATETSSLPQALERLDD